MIGFPLVIVDSKLDLPGIKPGPLDWHTKTITLSLDPCTVKPGANQSYEVTYMFIQQVVYNVPHKTVSTFY